MIASLGQARAIRTSAASFGVAAYVPGTGADAFFQWVDKALYAAKNKGRDQYVSACPEMQRLDPTATAEAEDRLRQTLAAHLTTDGVHFHSRSWLVTARRPS